MIDYQGKAVSGGLHAHLTASGICVVEADGVLVAVGATESAAQAAISSYSLDAERAWSKSRVNQVAKAKRDTVVATYSSGEMASWPIKDREAALYLDEATAASLCPLLHAEATARGVTVASIKARVVSNAAAFRAVEAAISGRAGALRDQIEAASTFAAIAAIDVSAGWPV